MWYFIKNKKCGYIIFIIKWVVVRPISLFIVSLYVIRAWLLYFDMKVSQLTKNLEWRMAINPTLASSNNWYLEPQNQRRYGQNGIYLVCFAIVFAIMETAVCGICYAWISRQDEVHSWLPVFVLVAFQFVKVELIYYLIYIHTFYHKNL